MRSTAKTLALWLPLAVACLASGCSTTEWTGPAKAGETPAKLKTATFLIDRKLAEVDAQHGILKGSTSEVAQVAGAVAGEVAKALVKP